MHQIQLTRPLVILVVDLPVAEGVTTDIFAIQEESVKSMQDRHPPLACPLGEREKSQGNSMLCLHKGHRG